MKHTYILEEGIWRASGQYWDENQNCINVQGKTEITHNKSNWILDGYMELQLDNPIKFFNKYTIEPVKPERDYTFWTSENPALGTLIGSFMIINDTILSKYQSEDGQYSGVESLIITNSNFYKNRGFAFHNKQKLSSWAIELHRE